MNRPSTNPCAASPVPRTRTALLAFLLLLLTFVAYVSAINAGFIWDDDAYVQNNLTLRTAEGLERIWFEIGAVPQYYPLVHTTFWVEYQLWGLNARGYHVVNILLHALSAVLLMVLLRRLALPALVALVAAAVFAVHPVHVESVAWITERKNVLSMVFYLAALLAYLRFVKLDNSPPPDKPRWSLYFLSLLLFLCALLSKTVTCSLPAAILLLIWWKRSRIAWADVRPLLPMFVLGLGFGLLTAWMEKRIVGAQGAEWDYSLIERTLIAGRCVWFYAGKLLWPHPLVFVYPRWEIDAGDWQQYLYPIAAAALVIALWWWRARIGRGPLVAALFFGGTLVPALGFFDVYPFRFSFVADHFQYHASLGVIVVVVAVAVCVINKAGRASGLIHATLWPVLLLVMMGTTWQQTKIYRDQETLWRDTVAKNPDSFIAHGNLAAQYLLRGESDLAIMHYHRALEIRNDLPEAHNTLGVEYGRRGNDEQAIYHFRAAINAQPQFAAAHNGLGAAIARQGDLTEAIEHFRRSVELLPELTDARMNLGLALFRTNQIDDAAEQFLQAIALEPNEPKAHYLLATVLAAQYRDEQAMHHFKQVLTLNPQSAEAHNAIGQVLMRNTRKPEAVEHFQAALRIRPDFAPAKANLEQCLSAESPDR